VIPLSIKQLQSNKTAVYNTKILFSDINMVVIMLQSNHQQREREEVGNIPQPLQPYSMLNFFLSTNSTNNMPSK
jgi:hypothetical protein